MNPQILVIHGGNAFEKYDEYLAYLRERDFSLDRFRAKDWKTTLRDVLGEDYDVLNPLMPNSQNARYAEWKIWFERIVLLLDEEVILIGHSLGGIFLTKYLSENDFPKKVKATLLVAAPFNTENEHPLVDFVISRDLKRFERQGGKIILYHSTDDQVVPFSNSESYKKLLPKAELEVFENRGHFNQSEFPELVKDIKRLSTPLEN